MYSITFLSHSIYPFPCPLYFFQSPLFYQSLSIIFPLIYHFPSTSFTLSILFLVLFIPSNLPSINPSPSINPPHSLFPVYLFIPYSSYLSIPLSSFSLSSFPQQSLASSPSSIFVLLGMGELNKKATYKECTISTSKLVSLVFCFFSSNIIQVKCDFNKSGLSDNRRRNKLERGFSDTVNLLVLI